MLCDISESCLIFISQNKSYRLEVQAKEFWGKKKSKLDNLLPAVVRDLCLSELENKGNEKNLKGMTLCPVRTEQRDITNEK